MELFTLGTGAAWPDADRSAPAFLVKHEGVPYLIDCGGGTCHQLMKVGCKPSEITNILLTHIHIDHCVEFPSLVFGAYLTGKSGEFKVFGPKGVEHFTTSIFDSTYDFAKNMMKNLRKLDIIVSTKEFDGGVVLEENGLTISSLPVEHGINTLAFKFSAGGKNLVFSADTSPCENLSKISKNADVLVIECSFPESSGVKKGHCIPSQVGAIAEEANAKSIILTHLFPVCKGKEDEIIMDVKKYYNGEVTIAYDLQHFLI
jgi:ribonuclease Z